MAYDVDDFAEIKILNDTITSAIFDTWTIRLCERQTSTSGSLNDDDGCSGSISLSTFTDRTKPWLVIDGTASGGATQIGKYINFKTGFDAILLDGNGDVIDYLTVDNYKPQEQATCTGAALPFDYQASSPGASDKFIFRIPDGTGDWGSAPSASAPPTEDDTNDTAPGGGTLPTISVTDVTVNKGQTATFTFTLNVASPGTSVNYPVSLDYKTTGGNAVTNITNPVNYDYTYKTGTITFPANTPTGSTITVDISTNVTTPSTNGTVYFYFYLFNQSNAKILNTYPIGTILGNATAEWYMDETSWSNTANEVSDISSSANHGTPYNNVTTIFPGKLCNAGSFDGINDYVEIPHSASLIGTTQLTYAAWINPSSSWSTTSIKQILSKSVHGGGAGRAQMGIFSENNRLVGRAETAGGRYEVFTNLPALSSWTHVALVFSGNSLTFYINGVVAPNASATYPSSKVFNTTTLISNTDPLMISKRVGSDVYFFHGLIDEVLVMQSALPAGFIKTMYDNYQLGLNWNGASRVCSGALHHYEIDHDGSALTCNPEQVTIRACANAACTTPLYSSPVNITLSPSGWVGGNTQAITTGLLTPSLSFTTASTQALNITGSSVTPSAGLSATICKNTSSGVTGVVGTAACDLIFNDSGFIFDVTTQTSCATSPDITISAVRKSPTTEQCIPSFNGKTAALKFWTAYLNPTTGTKQAILNYSGTNYALNTTSPGTDVSMTFDSNGQAKFTLNYPDAGQLDLNATYTGSVATSDAGLSMTGNKAYVTKPAKLYVYSDDVNADCATNDSTCSAFTSAGSPFNLKVRAACADNTKTPNFVLNNIDVAHTNTAPAVVQGSLGVSTFNMVAADQGEHVINNQTVSEVGVFTFTASLPLTTNYFGETSIGTPALNTSTYVGRFYPHHFDTVVTHGCTGSTFTYSGQPFTVTAFARNLANATTLNYRDAFAFTGVTLSDANSATPATGTFTNNTILPASFSSDTATNGGSFGAGTQSNLSYTFNIKDTPQETLEIRAIDNKDSSSSNGYTEGTTEIRSGRARLENVFGPELTTLTMPLNIEYYSDNATPVDLTDDGFILNADDSCSTYNAVLGDLTNYTGNLSPGETTVTGAGTVAAGIANITFSAPGTGNEGSVNLLLNNTSLVNLTPNWLTYNWNVDCDNADGDDDITTGIDAGLCGPYGTASFGLHRGDDRIIYWREVF